MNIYKKCFNGIFVCSCCTFLLLNCFQENEVVLEKSILVEVVSEITNIQNLSVNDSLKAVMIKNFLVEKEVSLELLERTIASKSKDAQYWQTFYAQLKTTLKPPIESK